MTQNINVKKDAKVGLRKAMIPLGIIAAIFGLVFIFMHCAGVATTTNIKEKLVKAARYLAMPTCFLTLALAALMLAHGIMQLAKLNKANIKWEITAGIINTIVGVLMFVSFIIVITTIFSNEKWLYDDDSVNIYKNCAFMGIMTALAIYAVCLGKHFNKGLEGKNTNIKMMRVIGVAALVIAICNIVPVLLTVYGGFTSTNSLEPGSSKEANWIASSYAAKFSLAAFGTIALGILCMIPLAILGMSDKAIAKKNIIMWSVIGGIAFVLFVIPAAMMSLDHGAPKSWLGGDSDPKNIVITVFVLLAAIYSIVGAAIANVKTKQFMTKAPKAA